MNIVNGSIEQALWNRPGGGRTVRCVLADISARRLEGDGGALAGRDKCHRWPSMSMPSCDPRWGSRKDGPSAGPDSYEAGPVAIIPGTQRVLAGAFVKQGLQEADWRITMMEVAEPVLLEDVGRSQGGYPEKVYDKMCVCAPTAYFVSLNPLTLASYAPANRQSVFNWICDKPVGRGIGQPARDRLGPGRGHPYRDGHRRDGAVQRQWHPPATSGPTRCRGSIRRR